MQQSLRERQLSVTQWDKTLIFKNQISADDRKRGGTGESTKDSGVLIVNVAVKQTAAEDASFICHASCCLFLCWGFYKQRSLCLGQFLFSRRLWSSLALWTRTSVTCSLILSVSCGPVTGSHVIYLVLCKSDESSLIFVFFCF